MQIQSPAFQDKQRIPPMYTCDEDDVNPQLLISEVPEGARSLALIMDDPDSPTGTWVHWTAWNISPQITEIAENSAPEGAVEGMTSFGKTGYGGPCPHSGEHRYFFKLYALDTTLDLPAGADISQLNQAMQIHILEQVQLMGLYARQN